LGRRPARARRVPPAELGEPLARLADVGGKEAIVHGRSLARAGPESEPDLSIMPHALHICRPAVVSACFALERLAKDLFRTDHVASAVVTGASAWKGDRWITEVGAAGRLAWGDGETGTTAATWFDLASLTKPITALAAARLARVRRLDLGAPIVELLPEL